MSKILFIHGDLVVDETKEYLDGALLVEDEKILDVFAQSDKIKDIPSDTKVVDLKGSLVMPGFFDTHTHGINLIDYDLCDEKDFEKASYLNALSGTTSFIPSITYNLDPEEALDRLKKMDKFNASYCRFQGIHAEGPFLSTKHLGVGIAEKFLKPDTKLTNKYFECTDKIRQMTIAYEIDGAKDVAKILKEHGVKVMCGHSDALEKDLDSNVDGFTHLFNAMRPFHHRDMSPVNLALNNKYPFEIITDGLHIDENVLKVVFNQADKHNIMVITDSSPARGLKDGNYFFAKRNCIKKGTMIKTDDGHLAGSCVGINDELKVLKRIGVKYTDMVLYSGLNAYRFYGLDKEYGTLQKGKKSDFVVMDHDFNVIFTSVQGKYIYA